MTRRSGAQRAVLAPLLAALTLLLPTAAIAQSGPTATPPPAQTATPSPPAEAPRKLSAADVRLPAGYKIEPVPETKRGAEVRNVPEGYKMIAPDVLILLGAFAVPVLQIWAAVYLTRRQRARSS